jgi:hypothetical protein
MGIINRKPQNIKETESSSINEELSLSKQEIEVLLNMVRTNSFLGEHVESVYNMVIKLQKQYLNIKD